MKQCGRLLILALLIAIPRVAAADEAFAITDFHTDIVVEKDSGIVVHETISVDFGGNERHGIFRTIPTKYRTNTGATRPIRLTDVALEQNNAPAEFDLSRDWGGGVTIKIGDPDVLISGAQTYELTYHVDNALNFFEGNNAELYWNATGNEWATPIGAARASVHLVAQGIPDETLAATAYQGVSGSTEAANASVVDGGFTFSTNRALEAGEGLTIVAGMPTDMAVYPPSTLDRVVWFITDNWILLLPALVLIWLILHFQRHGKDPLGRRTVVPEFAPPKGLTLLEQAALRDERLQARDLTALIVSWAVDGFITINEPKRGQYELRKKQDLTGHSTSSGQVRPTEEEAFFSKIFGDKSTVTLSDIQHTLADAASKLRTATFKRLVDQRYVTKNPETVRARYLVLGVICLVGSLWFGFTFAGLPGFTALFLTGLIFLVAAPFMPKRTEAGVALKEKIDGFQLYLRTAERYRLQFAEKRSLAESRTEGNGEGPLVRGENLFERYLPYAIAFGVATLWAKAFGDLAKAAPSWYSGYYVGNWSTTNFARGIESGFSSSISNAITTASSGGSGFSGGGSGGGFGGGGGGSW